jgi:hypothetical protein
VDTGRPYIEEGEVEPLLRTSLKKSWYGIEIWKTVSSSLYIKLTGNSSMIIITRRV